MEVLCPISRHGADGAVAERGGAGHPGANERLAPNLAIVAAIGVAAIVNYLGCAFFVFPPPDTRLSPPIRWRITALGIVAYVLLLRMFYLGMPDLLMEEAYY